VKAHFQQPPQDWAATGDFSYPSQGIIWPAGAYANPWLESATVNAPPDTVGVRAGMEVESSDGHKVGSVDALDTEPPTGQVTWLVIKQGLLFTHDTTIGVDAVAGVENDRVTLNLSRDEVRTRFEEQQSGE